MSSLRWILALVSVAAASVASELRADVTIAAASNLVYALESLKKVFAAAHPDIPIKTITGASGTLFAQIKGGAPYDVFMSADVEYPHALVREKLGLDASVTVFARGRLAFWAPRFDVAGKDLAGVVLDLRLKKIALANPKTAPYGRAAKTVLERLGQWKDDHSARWVYGENISQTAQFVDSGNADAGFVALSLLRSPRFRNDSHYLLIPEDWHAPLDHAAVITRHGEGNPDVREFVAFLRSTAARKVCEEFGYSVPD